MPFIIKTDTKLLNGQRTLPGSICERSYIPCNRVWLPKTLRFDLENGFARLGLFHSTLFIQKFFSPNQDHGRVTFLSRPTAAQPPFLCRRYPRLITTMAAHKVRLPSFAHGRIHLASIKVCLKSMPMSNYRDVSVGWKSWLEKETGCLEGWNSHPFFPTFDKWLFNYSVRLVGLSFMVSKVLCSGQIEFYGNYKRVITR